MKIRLLDREEITEIYREKMPNDFATGEIKPLERILELSEREKYFCYGIFETAQDRETMVSYCFLVISEEKDAALLDYFAVADGLRGKGYGSRCFAMLKEEIRKKGLGNLILEVENPRFGADEAEKELRRRRIAFYIRNGMTLTHLRIFLYQVEYLVMMLDDKQMMKAAEQIYHVYQVLLKPDKIKTRLNISTNIRCIFISEDVGKSACYGENSGNRKENTENAERWTDQAVKTLEQKIKQKGILVLKDDEVKGGVEGAGGGERWEALRTFLAENGIEPEECMVFGDSDRDEELLRHAGVGIASENASYVAKNAANCVIKPGKQGLVAEVMEEILQIMS